MPDEPNYGAMATQMQGLAGADWPRLLAMLAAQAGQRNYITQAQRNMRLRQPAPFAGVAAPLGGQPSLSGASSPLGGPTTTTGQGGR